MRKLVLGLAVIGVMAGAATHVLACDRNSKDASNVSLVSSSGSGACKAHGGTSCASKTSAASASASCGDKAASTAACGDKSAMSAAGSDKGCSDFAFAIDDIHGQCCVEKVEKALSRVKGVQAVYVDTEARRAYTCCTRKIDSKAALRNLKKAGYTQAVFEGADAAHCAHSMSSTGAKSCHPEAKKSSKV